MTLEKGCKPYAFQLVAYTHLNLKTYFYSAVDYTFKFKTVFHSIDSLQIRTERNKSSSGIHYVKTTYILKVCHYTS